MEILVYYILPNIALFGSIYFLSKAIEWVTWECILFMTDETGESRISKVLDKIV